MEGINLQSANQYALHTSAGCIHTTPPNQLGISAGLESGNVGSAGSSDDGEDAADCSTSAGCAVAETKDGSFGQGFADNGGGVFAAQFDVTGVLYVSLPSILLLMLTPFQHLVLPALPSPRFHHRFHPLLSYFGRRLGHTLCLLCQHLLST